MTLLLLLGGGGGAPTPTDPTFPVRRYEIAFGYTWGDESMVWTDVTADVEDSNTTETRRGRSAELDRFQAGTTSFALRNDNRQYDPTHTTGPYYGDLVPMVPVRITAEYGATRTVFLGYVDGWPQSYTLGNRISVVSIAATDAFKLFNLAGLSDGAFTLDSPTLGVLDEDRIAAEGTLDTQRSDERIEAFLDAAGWPGSLRDISPGSTDCQSQDTSVSLLDALQAVEQAEDGFLYIEADGSVVFVGRAARQDLTRMAVSQATFTDAAGSDLPYADLTYRYDDQLIYNDVRRTRDGGSEQAAEDPESIRRYFRRTNSITDMVMVDDNVAADLAAVTLERYREPLLRIDSLVIDSGNNRADLFPLVLDLRILDRITVVRTPQEVGDPITQDLWIQGVNHSFTSGRWVTTYYVSPVDEFEFFTLDSAVLGVLDEDLIGA